MRSFRLVSLAAVASLFVVAQLPACGGSAESGVDGDGELDGAIDGGDDTGASSETSDDTSATTTDTGGADTGATTDDTGSTSVDTMPGEAGECTGPVTVPGCGLDTDCDGITDTLEGRYDPAGAKDTDGDGTPDYQDGDSDGDGVPDRLEWRQAGCADPIDSDNDIDGDGIPNFQDLDSDGNGLPDKDEVCPPAAVLTALGMPACTSGVPYDFDGDGVPDYVDLDNDHDSSKADKTIGLGDKVELADFDGKYVGLVDTDGDGIPDVYDTDSDNDFILDLDDGTTDDDSDKIAAFRDTDSDGDGVPDRCEARGKGSPTAADLLLPLVDTDSDGVADYRDLDSDGDYLADSKEDLNGNCTKDATETSRVSKDSDGDGHDDLVESVLTPSGSSSWALDATKDPTNQGKFYFVEPYSADGTAKPSPTSTPLALSTSLVKGDVAFMIDTTFSMRDIESALANSIADKIIPGLAAKIPDLQLGVVGYDDALAKPWGDSAGDSFVWFPNGGDPSKGSRMTSSTTDAIDAAKGLNKTTSGGTFPEGSVPALWWALTGDSFSFRACSSSTASCGGSVYPDVTKTFAGVTAPTGRFGGLHFRKDALPIVIQASDANMHNGLTTDCLDGSGVRATPCFPIAYSSDGARASSLGHSPTIQELRDKMVSIGAQYIGVSVHGGTPSSGTARSSLANRTTDNRYYQASVDMLYLARGTGAKVPPSVLGGSATDCKTSNPTATVANPADSDGLCPLVFDVPYTGAGLGDTVVNAVVALVNAIKFDVHVQAIPVIAGGVDPVDAFLANVPPMPGGGTDPVSKGMCVTFPATSTADRFRGPKALSGTDTVKETILDLTPGPLYCFAVTPKPNTTVAPKTTAQLFTARLRAYAQRPDGGTFALGTDREVLFIVPPVIN